MASDNAQAAKSEGLEHQDQSIKARKFQLFEEPKTDDGGLRKPFSQYLSKTPAAPMPPVIKASLWATGVLVVLLFLGAFILGGPKRVRKPRAAFAPVRPAAVLAWNR